MVKMVVEKYNLHDEGMNSCCLCLGIEKLLPPCLQINVKEVCDEIP